jgi:hypothetical protein
MWEHTQKYIDNLIRILPDLFLDFQKIWGGEAEEKPSMEKKDKFNSKSFFQLFASVRDKIKE